MPKCQDFFADPELPVLFFPARKIFRTKIRRPQDAGGRGVFCVFYAFVFRAGAAGFAQRLKKIEKGEFIRAYALLLSNFH